MSEPLPWSVPGYDVEAMIGFGATGEVWRARENATGEVVALKRLREGADPGALEALRREATLLRTLTTPYVVRLRAVVGDVLVLDHAPGGSLAALLTRRGCLDPGEVVTIAGPLAAALADAHALGLVHGDVSPANVLFTADGMPLLADLGVARVAGERLAGVDGTAEYVDPVVAAGGDPDAAADVWALAALCHHLLAGTPPHDGDSTDAVLEAAVAGGRAPLGLLAPHAPRALVAAVEAGLAADPADRPDAAALCSLLRRAHAAAPVRLATGPATYEPVRETHVVRAPSHAAPPTRRLPRLPALPRRALPAAALVLLVVLAAILGWASGRGQVAGAAAVTPLTDPGPTPAVATLPSAAPFSATPSSRAPTSAAPPSPARSPTAPPPAGPDGPAVPAAAVDWAAVLDGLDATRARAFAGAGAAALQQVWAAGSPGLAADTALVDELAARGHSAHGLRHAVRSVRVVEASRQRARLEVVDVLADHELRDRDGQVVQRVAARGSAGWRVELAATPQGWRLVSVVADT